MAKAEYTIQLTIRGLPELGHFLEAAREYCGVSPIDAMRGHGHTHCCRASLDLSLAAEELFEAMESGRITVTAEPPQAVTP